LYCRPDHVGFVNELTRVVIELTIFDILTRLGPNLTTEERDQVERISRQLPNG